MQLYFSKRSSTHFVNCLQHQRSTKMKGDFFNKLKKTSEISFKGFIQQNGISKYAYTET